MRGSALVLAFALLNYAQDTQALRCVCAAAATHLQTCSCTGAVCTCLCLLYLAQVAQRKTLGEWASTRGAALALTAE